MTTFQNVYTLRRVADTAAKGCEVCFKPSSSVLITAENKDFFYICPSHLKDKAFAAPIVDKAAEEAKKKKAEEDKEQKVKDEMERLKKEYEEKKSKKESKKDDKKDDKDKDGNEKEKEKDKKDDKDKDDNDAKEKDDSKDEPPKEEPRVFALQKFVFQQRLEKRRQAEIAKRNRERLTTPGYFPSVPKGAP